MLLALFTTFLALSIVLIWLGYYSKEGIWALMGSALLAFLGLTILITGSLEYKTGETTSTSYNYVATVLNNTDTVQADVYTSFTGTTSRTLGFWISLLGIMTFAVTMFELKTPTLQKADIMP